MDLTEILQNKFYKSTFRQGQKECIRAALNGENVLGVMPTGGGKSLIYQFLSECLKPDECVLVISPLVALIEDQYKQSISLGLKNTARVHSALNSKQKQDFFKNLKTKSLIFMTPERLLQDKTWDALKHLHIQYLVIDEAHCLSQWGHDFRPDYTRLPDFRKRMGQPNLIALTATATQRVKQEVQSILDPQSKENWFLYQAPVFRENLHLNVYEAYAEQDKLQRLEQWMQALPQAPKILYFSLVQTLERVSAQLEKRGWRHVKYHGQLPAHLKQKNQNLFFDNKESLILATPAFGLGVNKPDIRCVLHFELPQSIEALFQEVGRAGRDGKKAWCEVFYDGDDVSIHMDFLKWNHPEPDFIYSLYKLICDYPERFVQEGNDFLREKLNFYNRRDFRTETAINLLKRWDLLQVSDHKAVTQPLERLKDIPDMNKTLHEKRKKAAQMRLLDLVQVLEKYKSERPIQTESVLQNEIVDYFLKDT